MHQADSKYLQSQCNNIEKYDDDVKLLSTYIKKMQNTAEVETLASNGTAPSTKGAVGKKVIDISIRKVIYITS